MDYLKYYNLEEYLFTDVNAAFHARGCLTAEEFFAIIIWKAERAKSLIKRKVLTRGPNLNAAVAKLTRAVHDGGSDEARLRILLDDWNFALPMASAVLSVLYPDRFTVYDTRVRAELSIKDFAGRRDQVARYFSDFMPKVKAIEHSGTLRDKDRYLWGKSWHKGLEAFLSK